MNKYELGKSYLVTTQDWFFAPDGETYKAVFGVVNGIHSDAETLGVKTNRNSSNWFISIGNMSIAGCQIHYAIRTDSCSFEKHTRELEVGGGIALHKAPTRIYNAGGDV